MAKKKQTRRAAAPLKKKSKKISIPDCRKFSGYKPCVPGALCHVRCVDRVPFGKRILIVNLDAMGAVLQTTAMLPAIKRKYPDSHISWLTMKNARPLLEHNPLLDAVYAWEPDTLLVLGNIQFDAVFSVDKTQRACAFVNQLKAKKKFGFGMNNRGAIVPLTPDAEYFYRIGLDDELKFRENRMPGTQIVQEAMGLRWKRDGYVLELSAEEQAFCESYKPMHGLDQRDLIVGFNTGCSNLFKNKKMTIEQHVTLINRLADEQGIRLVLVGGPEDTERNAELVRRVGSKIVNTPTEEGVRKGLCYEAICDVIITGDSFGMHAAIALKKTVIVWFGLTCWEEIDLYDRGIKLTPDGLACAPCWKKECPYNLECISMIDLEKIVAATLRYRDVAARPRH